MQRLFSMFPPGLPGIGLLLLRASVATALLFEHYAYRGALSTSVLIVILVVSLAITVGYMTPIAAVLGVLFHVLTWFSLGGTDLTLVAVGLLDAFALTLLGPGAYSLDAVRFGRRVVVLPPP